MTTCRSILVVEDDQMSRYLLVHQLARLGHKQVTAVTNGLEALHWLDQNECRLVLSDCQMPVMDGYEMTRRIRHREYNSGRHTPVIALSAGVLAADRASCIEAGMDDHIAKPVQLATLAAALKPWLRDENDA
jgi:CheY-like chemotaxis protein